jgi:hypothetical protein
VGGRGVGQRRPLAQFEAMNVRAVLATDATSLTHSLTHSRIVVLLLVVLLSLLSLLLHCSAPKQGKPPRPRARVCATTHHPGT